MDPLDTLGFRFPGKQRKPVPRELLGSRLSHHHGLEVFSSSWTDHARPCWLTERLLESLGGGEQSLTPEMWWVGNVDKAEPFAS